MCHLSTLMTGCWLAGLLCFIYSLFISKYDNHNSKQHSHFSCSFKFLLIVAPPNTTLLVRTKTVLYSLGTGQDFMLCSSKPWKYEHTVRHPDSMSEIKCTVCLLIIIPVFQKNQVFNRMVVPGMICFCFR